MILLTPSLPMHESPVPNAPQCNRCGACCRDIAIAIPPERFQGWIDNEPDSPGAFVGRMLIGTHRGEVLISQDVRGNPRTEHLYGPCPNLVTDADGLSACAIHETRPDMCRNFPYYGGMLRNMNVNPSQLKGCSYNADIEAGFSAEDYERMLQERKNAS